MYQELSALIGQLSLLAAQLHIGGEDLDELRKMEGQEKKVGLVYMHLPPLHCHLGRFQPFSGRASELVTRRSYVRLLIGALGFPFFEFACVTY